MLGANGAPEVSLLRSWNRMNTISYRTITTIVSIQRSNHVQVVISDTLARVGGQRNGFFLETLKQ